MNQILAYYTVNFNPYAIRFPEGWPVEGIRWYGLAYLAGFLIAMLLLEIYTKEEMSPLKSDDNSSLMTYLLFGVILGGRLGYMLFYDFPNFVSNPLIAFQIWKGGMSSHGGFIGVVLAVLLFCRNNKKPFWKISDIIVTICAPGLFLGRIANFINGELWGKISNVPWAMIFPNSAPGIPVDQIAARHPSQLYEAALEGIFILLYTQWRFWKFKLPKGQLSGEFLVVYAAVRIFCEVFREPDEGISLIMGLSRGTFYSLGAFVAGAAIIVYSRIKEQKK